MAGGLCALVVNGDSQDLYFTKMPQITFFNYKTVFRRHSRFTIELKEFDFNEQTLKQSNETYLQMKIPYDGDLLKNLYISLDLPNIYSGLFNTSNSNSFFVNQTQEFKWIEELGTYLFKEGSIKFNGRTIQHIWGELQDVRKELTFPQGKKDIYNKLTGNIQEMHSPGFTAPIYNDTASSQTPLVENYGFGEIAITYPVEYFSFATFDLNSKRLTYTPADTNTKYDVAVSTIIYSATGAGHNTWDNTGSNQVNSTDLADDVSAEITLTNAFTFYGTAYTTMYLGSNGYITFESTDTTYTPSLANHFTKKRISIFSADINPTSVNYYEDEGGFVYYYTFTAQNIFGSTTEKVSFQLKLYLNGHVDAGKIEMDYGTNTTSTTMLVGLSNITSGTPTNFLETDLSLGWLTTDPSSILKGHKVNFTPVVDDNTLKYYFTKETFTDSRGSDATAYTSQLYPVENFLYYFFDLENKRITFTPADSNTTYDVSTDLITYVGDTTTHSTWDNSGGNDLGGTTMSDDTFGTVTLANAFTFYGTSYTTIYIGTNGYITFGSGDTTSANTLANHFAKKRISFLFENLNPTTSFYQEDAINRIFYFTFVAQPEQGTANNNSCQIRLYLTGHTDAGQIQIDYGTVDVNNPTIGLSNITTGTPGGFTEIDLHLLSPFDVSSHTPYYNTIDSAEISLGADQFRFYGTQYSTLYLGKDGYITFVSEDNTLSFSLANHFTNIRISLNFNDYTSRQLYYYHDTTNKIFYYTIIRAEVGINKLVDMQLALYLEGHANEGKIDMSFETVSTLTSTQGITGISNVTTGTPAGYLQPDLTSTLTCANLILELIKFNNVIIKEYPHSRDVETSLGAPVNLYNVVDIDYSGTDGGDNSTVNNISKNDQTGGITSSHLPSINGRKIRIPLIFWFNDLSGMSLPLLAMDNTNIELNLTLRPLEDLYTTLYTHDYVDVATYNKLPITRKNAMGKRVKYKDYIDSGSGIQYFINTGEENGIQISGANTNLKLEKFNANTRLLVNYIHLDTETKRKFSKELTYLIDKPLKIERKGLPGDDFTLEFTSNNHIKELYIIPKRSDAKDLNQWDNFTNWIPKNINPFSYIFNKTINPENAVETVYNETTYYNTKLQQFPYPHYRFSEDEFNRFTTQKDIIKNIEIEYNDEYIFSKQSGIYYQNTQPLEYYKNNPKDGVYIYSFALEPKNYNSSGTLNSNDKLKLNFEFNRIPNKNKFNTTASVTETQVVSGKNASVTTTISGENAYVSHYSIDISVYVIEYNILEIKNGIGSLLFN